MTTQREADVLELLLAAVPRVQIADRLGVAPPTLGHYVERLLHHRHAADARILVALVWKERYTALQATLAERTRERDQCRRDLAAIDRRQGR